MGTPLLVITHNVHLWSVDGDWVWTGPLIPEVRHQLLCLCDVELQMVLFTPLQKPGHHTPVLSLLVTADTADGRVTWELLQVAGLWLEPEVRGVVWKGREIGPSPVAPPCYSRWYQMWYANCRGFSAELTTVRRCLRMSLFCDFITCDLKTTGL